MDGNDQPCPAPYNEHYQRVYTRWHEAWTEVFRLALELTSDE